MNANIITSLLLFSKKGKITAQFICEIPENLLHKIYETTEIHGIAHEKDLIGQSRDLNLYQMEAIKQFVGEQYLKKSYFRPHLITYEKCDTPKLLQKNMELRLSVFDMNDDHVGYIYLPRNINLIELRQNLCLPEYHNLVGDFPLDSEWQVTWFLKYVHDLDFEKFHYELSPCDRAM
jgi:hypothetical protein